MTERQIVVEVADRVGRRLRSGDRVARTVTLRLRFADFVGATRSRTLTRPTRTTDIILTTARDLLDEAWSLIECRGLTKVGVAVSNLDGAGAIQLALPFPSADWGSVDGAVDEIRARFGIAAVTRASLAGRSTVEMPMLPDH